MESKRLFTSFLVSLVTLMLCLVSFAGTTFAWFTDTVSNTGNKIQAGTLDVELYASKQTLDNAGIDYTNLKRLDETNYYDVSTLSDENPLFSYNLWEPGYSTPTGFVVKNNGNLALKYELTFYLTDSKTGLEQLEVQKASLTDGVYKERKTHLAKVNANSKLENAIEVYKGETKLGTLKDFFDGKKSFTGHLSAGQVFETGDLKLIMPTDKGNEYENASISFDIRLLATQYTEEYDGFGSNQYDALADEKPNGEWAPIYYKAEQSEEVNVTVGEKTVVETSLVSVTVPANATVILEDGTQHSVNADDKFRLEVKETENDTAETKITVAAGQTLKNCEVDLIKIDSSNNETIVTGIVADKYYGEVSVNDILGVDTLLDLQGFYHKGTPLTRVNTFDKLVNVGQYFYDVTDNKIKFFTDSFSPYETVFEFAGGQGTKENPYLIADENHLKRIYNYLSKNQGKYTYFKQVADIENFSGYGNTSYYYFVGEYDGGNHKIVPKKSFGKAGDLFDLYYGETTIKNLNLYSTDNAPIALVYSTYYADKLNVENVNFYATDNSTININAGNFGFITRNPINDQRVNPDHGQTFNLKNVNNYINVENIGNCAAAYFGSGCISCLSTSKGRTENCTFIFNNCHNYGNISSALYAGVVWGNGSYNYLFGPSGDNISEEDMKAMVVFENGGLVNHATISASTAHAFADTNTGSSFILNKEYQEVIGGTYITKQELSENYKVYFDGSSFTVDDGESSDNYTYKVALSVGSIYHYGKNGLVSNGRKVVIPASVSDEGTLFKTSNVHAYDKKTAISKGIISSNTVIDYNYECDGLDVDLIYKNDMLYIIFDEELYEPDLYVDSAVSTYIYAYDQNNVCIKFKEISQ